VIDLSRKNSRRIKPRFSSIFTEENLSEHRPDRFHFPGHPILYRKQGASYRFTIITNGSLLTRRVAEKLAPLGLENVKITIDGPAEIHDRNRPFKSGAGSFHTIIHNIHETCDLVSISIGGNYESHNYEKFPLLLDYLMSSGLTPDRLRGVKFDPVMKGPDQRPLHDHFKGGCTSIYEPWIVRAEALLRERNIKKGLQHAEAEAHDLHD
jgi:uncharacterized protein